MVAAFESGDWEFRDCDTQAWTHNVHRYSGKFVPQIAHKAIELTTDPGDLVFDPYCGSGTTLLEASRTGRRAVGSDLSPLAVLVSRVKTTPVAAAALARMRDQLDALVAALLDEAQGGLFTRPVADDGVFAAADADPRGREDWFRKWFQPAILRQLLVLWHGIDRVEDPAARDVARVAFSDVLRRSSNAHSGYPNVMYDKRLPAKQPPAGPFRRRLAEVTAQVTSLQELGDFADRVDVQLGNAAEPALVDAVADAVITHPPYIGSIPYAEYGALSLTWLGCDPKDLDSRLTGGRRQRKDVVERFRAGYRGMFAGAARVLKPGGYVFVLVGNPTVKGTVIDLAALSLEYADAVGLEPVARAERAGINRRANKMGAEALLLWRKPTA